MQCFLYRGVFLCFFLLCVSCERAFFSCSMDLRGLIQMKEEKERNYDVTAVLWNLARLLLGVTSCAGGRHNMPPPPAS